MYNCERQIVRVLAQLNEEVRQFVSGVLVVDNRSSDGGREAAQAALAGLGMRAELVQNDANYGLGGSHKVAFEYALREGYDHVVVLHGDDQGSIADLLPHLRSGAHESHQALLGSRFMRGSRLKGYSLFRTIGNYGFNALYSLALGHVVSDLGSGLNVYATAALRDRWWLKNADDLTFNYHMLLRSYAAGWRMKFFPLTWREDDQVSNVKLFRQASRVARLPFAYFLTRKAYLTADYSSGAAYTSTTIARYDG